MGVLPLTDGSTAVSAVLSHCLADGIAGMVLRSFDAVTGNIRDLGYPPPHSRTRLRAWFPTSVKPCRAAPEVCPGARCGGKTGVSSPAR